MNLIHTRGAWPTIIRTPEGECCLNGKFEGRRLFSLIGYNENGWCQAALNHK